jgi:protein disulfide-isomerase-like protein
MKTKFVLLALSLLVATAISAEVEYEEGVAILTDDNFQQVLDDNEYVFVKFFAPWCGHCKQMKPHFIAAADLYFGEEAETPVVFADLDATVHGETARQHGVSSYPTLKLFVNGEPIDFKGGRDEDGMIEWIEKKLEPATQAVDSLGQLEEEMENNRVLVLFFGETGGPQFSMFDILAKNFDGVMFVTTDSDEIASEFSL